MKIQQFDQGAKGRRKCPALGGWITTKTCGKHRLIDIQCPSDCKYLGRHERYQHARVANAFHLGWLEKVTPLYQQGDQLALDFLVQTEFALYKYLRSNPTSTDGDVLEGLEFLHRQLSPIQMVESFGTPLGKHLVQSTANYEQEHPKFDPERGQDMVDILIELAQAESLDGRQTINGFMGHLEANFDLTSIEEAAKDEDVISPRIVTPH